MAKQGQAAYDPTPGTRRQVQEMVACGESKETIARALGHSVKTIEKHFADELSTGLAKKRLEAVALLWESARAGNVSAQKKVEELTRATALKQNPEDGVPLPGNERIGKEEAAKRAAHNPDVSTPIGELMSMRTTNEKPN